MSRTFLLQDWVTIRGTNSGSPTAFTQDQERWLDLAGYSDAACWIDVMEVTPPAGNTSNYLTLNLETAGECDDTYFIPMTPSVPFDASGVMYCYQPSTIPVVARSTRAVSTTALMRYLRWKIVPSAVGLWDLTFRIRAVATRSNAFVPTDIAGCALWLRSDLGVTAPAGSVTAWKDQSGNAADAVPPGTAPLYRMNDGTGNGISNLPRIRVASGQSLSGTLASNVAAHTVFAVLGFASPIANSAAFAATDGSGTVNSGFALFTESGTSSIIGRAGDGVTFTSATTTTVTSLGNIGVYSSAAQTGGAVDLFVNGSPMSSVATALTLVGRQKYFLFQLGGGSYPFVGDAYEFVIYNNVLRAADRTRVHRYLGARYNIAVP